MKLSTILELDDIDETSPVQLSELRLISKSLSLLSSRIDIQPRGERVWYLYINDLTLDHAFRKKSSDRNSLNASDARLAKKNVDRVFANVAIRERLFTVLTC